jgi:hypothetical protein
MMILFRHYHVVMYKFSALELLDSVIVTIAKAINVLIS